MRSFPSATIIGTVPRHMIARSRYNQRPLEYDVVVNSALKESTVPFSKEITLPFVPLSAIALIETHKNKFWKSPSKTLLNDVLKSIPEDVHGRFSAFAL